MSWQSEMKRKHDDHILFHQQAYGAPLGVLKREPTKEMLDKDFKRRKAEGTLFSQTEGQRLEDRKK